MLCKVPSFLKHDVILLSGFHLGEMNMFTCSQYSFTVNWSTHTWSIYDNLGLFGHPNGGRKPEPMPVSRILRSIYDDSKPFGNLQFAILRIGAWEDGIQDLDIHHFWRLQRPSMSLISGFWLTQPKFILQSPPQPRVGQRFFPAFQVWPACKMQEVIVSC